jgi:hypothetical protein
MYDDLNWPTQEILVCGVRYKAKHNEQERKLLFKLQPNHIADINCGTGLSMLDNDIRGPRAVVTEVNKEIVGGSREVLITYRLITT